MPDVAKGWTVVGLEAQSLLVGGSASLGTDYHCMAAERQEGTPGRGHMDSGVPMEAGIQQDLSRKKVAVAAAGIQVHAAPGMSSGYADPRDGLEEHAQRDYLDHAELTYRRLGTCASMKRAVEPRDAQARWSKTVVDAGDEQYPPNAPVLTDYPYLASHRTSSERDDLGWMSGWLHEQEDVHAQRGYRPGDQKIQMAAYHIAGPRMSVQAYRASPVEERVETPGPEFLVAPGRLEYCVGWHLQLLSFREQEQTPWVSLGDWEAYSTRCCGPPTEHTVVERHEQHVHFRKCDESVQPRFPVPA